MEKKSVFVHKPDDIPRQEHWAIIEGSYVHHAEEGVWAPGHGYPAYTEDVISYQAFFNEKEFLDELTHKFNAAYGSDRVVGIHVNKLYTKQTVIKVVEQELPGQVS
jgi:hypothetical protein